MNGTTLTYRAGGVYATVDLTTGTVSWVSGLAVDADGSANCYHATPGKGLDALANAGKPGRWWGLACDARGNPYVQTATDPAEGFFVATTSLCDHTKQPSDPTRYVDSSTVPYVSVPRGLVTHVGVRPGDLAWVEHGGVGVGAVVADVGGDSAIGEGSIALAQMLGIDPFRGKPAHHLLGVDSGVSFRVFMNTATSPAWPRDDIQVAAAAAMRRLSPA